MTRHQGPDRYRIGPAASKVFVTLKTAVLINDTSTKPHLGCRLVVARITELCLSVDIRVRATSSVHTDWRSHPDLKDTMRNASIVIVNGEGTLHDSTLQAAALAAVGPFCRSIGVPAVLINSVYQRNDKQLAEDCSAFSRIYVRESASALEATRAGLVAEVAADLTLSSNVTDKYKELARKPTIAVTDNANKDIGERTLDYALGRSDVTFLNLNSAEESNPFLMESLLPELVYTASGRISRSPAPKRPRRTIYKAFRKALFKSHFQRRMGMYRNLSAFHAHDEILQALSTSRAVVAGRFHAACLSLVAGTPFGALVSNTSKTEGMLRDAGLAGKLSADPRAAFDIATSWTDRDRYSASAYVDGARRQARDLFDDIASLAL